ncbi:DNRLRE domain-containing protein [Nocardioides piscis]|uniref:DNRLRE domain-containing protein n=1 Tax=Nocardioides piscis TaxID=2714938 RepID=A0A6G7YCE7_9ACTN|nr:DNRLRE domain-containing protein [Nocardioides piscis]
MTNPVIGNHEYSADDDAQGYFGYWKSPPHYYSYDSGGWHFVALDSTSKFATSVPGVLQNEPSTVPGVRTQYDWLADDLAANAGKCTVAYFHHPVFNQGEESAADRMRSVWSLLANNRVTAALTAHDHDYQRFAPLDGSAQPDPRGVTQFIVGAGGHSTQEVVLGSQPGPDPVEWATGFGAMKMVLHPDRLDFSVAAPNGTSGGRLLDSGSIPCQSLAEDTTPPTVGQLSANTSLQGNLPRVSLEWPTAQDDRGVARYDVVRDGTVIEAGLPATATSFLDTTVQPGRTYTYRLRARDAWGNKTLSDEVAVTTPEQTSSPTVAPLLADTYVASTSPSPKGATDRLRVVQSSSATNVAYMKFDLRQFSGTIESATLTMTPAANTSAKATARAVADTSWTEAGLGWPGPALGSTGGTTQTALKADVPVQIDVTDLISTGQTNSLALVQTSGTTTMSFYSKEATGKPAPRLTVTVTRPPDTTPPTTPGGLSATPDGENEIDLAWQPATDDVLLDHYVVYRDGEAYDEVPASETTYRDVVVGAGQTWHYRVSAVDHVGNESPLSEQVQATTVDIRAPEAVEGPMALATSARTALVTWEGGDDNVAIAGFVVHRDGVAIAEVGPDERHYVDSGLEPGTTYVYSLSAFDAAGNASVAGSATAPPITTPQSSDDTTPPARPENLDVTALSGSSVRLVWDPATDDVEVASYTVFRDGEPAFTSTSTSFEVTGLSSPSTQTWTVDAVDTSGNHSAMSAPVTFTTPDDVPPQAPSSLTATASSYRSVALTWPPATDNVAVVRYAIHRDGSLIGHVTGTSYTDGSAAPATSYQYAVSAEDASMNQSPRVLTQFTTPAIRTDDSGWLTVADSGYAQSGSSAATNYKFATILRVSGGTTQKVGYLKVHVPARVLPELEHLYLQLTTTDGSNPGFDVHAVADNGWDRATLTWNNKPAWSPTVLASSGKVTGAGVVPTPPGTIDLREAINGPGTYSFALVSSSSLSQTYASSYTSVPSADRPRVRWLSHD